MSGGAAQLRSVLLLVRDAAKAMRFYADGLRLPVIQPLSSTTGSAELRLGRQALSLNTHTQSRLVLVLSPLTSTCAPNIAVGQWAL